MAVGRHKRAIGVFPERRDAEYALHELRDSGFSMDQVSVIAKNADQDDEIAGADVRDHVGNHADDGAKTGAIAGGALGGLTGLLVGLGALAIPGIGPVMLAGATATTIATTLSGTAIGAVTGGLLGALIGLGIPEERAKVYNDRVSRGQYLVIIDGTDEEIATAEAILHHRGIEEYGIYDAPNAARTNADSVATPTAGVTDTNFGSKYAVGYFDNRRDADRAFSDLRTAGFPLNQVSIILQNSEQRESFPGSDVSDRFDAIRMGFPDDRARFYNDQVSRGGYVVIVKGTEDEVHHAGSILSNSGIQDWQIYDPTQIGSTSTGSTTTIGGTDRTPMAATPATYDTTTSSHRETPNLSGRRKRALGLFPNRHNAEAALTELRNSGFDMDRVSVIAKHADSDDQLAGADVRDRVGADVGNKADEGAKAGAATGGALGGLGGLLVGLGTLAIPGVGPIVLAGAGATALATTLAGGAIGAAAGGLGGALVGAGIPDEHAKVYNDRVTRGDYLVMVDGTDEEIATAEAILNRRGIQEFGIYDAPGVDVDANRTNYDYVNPETRRGIDTHPGDTQVISEHPDVVIIDHRDQTR